jgi:hypothetical protein
LISCFFHKPAAVYFVLQAKYSIEETTDPIRIVKKRNHAPLARPQTISVVERGPGVTVARGIEQIPASSRT